VIRRRITGSFGERLRSREGATALALACLLGCGRSELYAIGERGRIAPDAGEPFDDAAGADDSSDGPVEVGALDAGQIHDASDAAMHDADASGADACPAGGCLLVFDSGRDWSSWSGTISSTSFILGSALGSARDVCLNTGNPGNCPSDALLYGYASSPPPLIWSGGTSIPSAFWIWRADVTPSAPASKQVAIFQKSFVVGAGATGSILISVDDMAKVFVNATLIETVGSATDINAAAAAHMSAAFLDLTSGLRTGTNVITIAAENGPFGSSPYTYAVNPAGVVFEGTLRWR
jgi:hypothetical protein